MREGRRGSLTVRLDQLGDSVAVRPIGDVDMSTVPTFIDSLRVQPRPAGHGPTLFAGLSKRVDLKLVGRL